METSIEITEIAKAMCSMQGDMEGAHKEGLNPHYKSRYVTLDAVWSCIRPHLKLNGLSVMQDVTSEGNTVSVETRVLHTSGQWMKFGPLVMPLGKLDPQSIGSCTSYARRYSLCSALGVVAGEDDDGEAAMSRAQPQKTQETKPSMISKEQLEQINEELKWIDESVKKKILVAYNINSIEMLPASSFASTMIRLKAISNEKKAID